MTHQLTNLNDEGLAQCFSSFLNDFRKSVKRQLIEAGYSDDTITNLMIKYELYSPHTIRGDILVGIRKMRRKITVRPILVLTNDTRP